MLGLAAPGLFTATGDGRGAPAGQVLRVHGDGSSDAPQDLATYDAGSGKSSPNPITPGTPGDILYLILYGTGIRHFASTPTCTIGHQTIPVDYAGAQGAFEGLDQINVRLPANLAAGETLPLTVTVDGVASNTVTLMIQ